MIKDLEKDFVNAQCQKKLASIKLGLLSSKLESARKLKIQIEDLTKHEDFMTEDQVKEEELRTKECLEEPLKIIASIEEFENKSDYLNYNKLLILRSKIESARSTLREPDESESYLKCIICLSVPKVQKGSAFIYSCDQDHLFCKDCIQTVDSCPSKFFFKFKLN
jgi:hypothetical protein